MILAKKTRKEKGKKIHKFDIKISFRNRGGWLKHNWCTIVCGCKKSRRSLTIAGFDGREREIERRGIES